MAELVTREKAEQIVRDGRCSAMVIWDSSKAARTIIALYDRIEQLEAALLQHPNLNLSAVLGYDAGKQENAARIAELERLLRRFFHYAPREVHMGGTFYQVKVNLRQDELDEIGEAALKGTQG
jgi:hypothetical protein